MSIPALPWDFAPGRAQRQGQARRDGDHQIQGAKPFGKTNTLVGTATDNVQPDKAGPYFDKIQCFCFTKQTVKAGQTVELPVQFYVDPAMAEDPRAGDVTNITLSYTFFLAKDRATNTKAPLTGAPLSSRDLGHVGQSIQKN